MAKDLFIGCAEQLATSPDLVERLLDVHTSTADGWCTGHQIRPERHPCSIRRLAELAAGYAAERPRVPMPAVTSQHSIIA